MAEEKKQSPADDLIFALAQAYGDSFVATFLIKPDKDGKLLISLLDSRISAREE